MSKKSVGIWIRVSTDEQARGDSPEHHFKRAEAYSKIKDWKVKETYRLEGVSGKSVLSHPETIRMLNDVKRGHISGIIFSNLSRLGRSTRELLDISDIFQANQADLVSLSEEIDTSTASGRLFFTIQGALAQHEREEIAKRVKASVRVRAEMGKSLGGQAPYGYSWKNKVLVLNEEEAAIRKLMYDLFLKHKRKKAVARILTNRGHRTRNNSKFSDTTVTRLLKDPIAKGLRRIHYTQTKDNTKNWQPKPESEWLYIKAPVIIPEAKWNKVQELLDTIASSRKKPARTPVHVFTSLIFCDCSGPMYFRKQLKKYVCNKCKRKIVAKDLETIFKNELQDYVLQETDLREHISEAGGKKSALENEISLLKKKEVKLIKRIDSLVELHTKGEIPTKGFGNLYNPLEAELNTIQESLPILEAEKGHLSIESESVDQIITDAQELYKNFDSFDRESKRRVVQAITKRITIKDTEVLIDLLYASPKHKLATGGGGGFFDGFSINGTELMPSWQRNYRGS